MEIIFGIVYFVGWLIYVVFSALLVDEDDRPAVVWISIISGSIWFATVPLMAIGYLVNYMIERRCK